MKDSLIVVSGGMDSITLLYEYADREIMYRSVFFFVDDHRMIGAICLFISENLSLSKILW